MCTCAWMERISGLNFLRYKSFLFSWGRSLCYICLFRLVSYTAVFFYIYCIFVDLLYSVWHLTQWNDLKWKYLNTVIPWLQGKIVMAYLYHGESFSIRKGIKKRTKKGHVTQVSGVRLMGDFNNDELGFLPPETAHLNWTEVHPWSTAASEFKALVSTCSFQIQACHGDNTERHTHIRTHAHARTSGPNLLW